MNIHLYVKKIKSLAYLSYTSFLQAKEIKTHLKPTQLWNNAPYGVEENIWT